MVDQIRKNMNAALELLDSQQAAIQHLQQRIKQLESVLKDYEKAYGSHEDAIMQQAANQYQEIDDDFCPDPNEVL